MVDHHDLPKKWKVNWGSEVKLRTLGHAQVVNPCPKDFRNRSLKLLEPSLQDSSQDLVDVGFGEQTFKF